MWPPPAYSAPISSPGVFVPGGAPSEKNLSPGATPTTILGKPWPWPLVNGQRYTSHLTQSYAYTLLPRKCQLADRDNSTAGACCSHLAHVVPDLSLVRLPLSDSSLTSPLARPVQASVLCFHRRSCDQSSRFHVHACVQAGPRACVQIGHFLPPSQNLAWLGIIHPPCAYRAELGAPWF